MLCITFKSSLMKGRFTSLPASTNQALPYQASCMQQMFDWLYASAHTGSSRPVLLALFCFVLCAYYLSTRACEHSVASAGPGSPDTLDFHVPGEPGSSCTAARPMHDRNLAQTLDQGEPNNSKLHPLSLANEDAVNQTAPSIRVPRAWASRRDWILKRAVDEY